MFLTHPITRAASARARRPSRSRPLASRGLASSLALAGLAWSTVATAREPTPEAALQQPAPEAAPQQPAPEAAPQQPAPEAAPQQPAPEAAPQQPAPEAASPAQNPAERRALEAELAPAMKPDPSSPPSSPPPLASGGPSPLRLLDLSLDLVGAAGTSSASESELRSLQAGGHDPKNKGFTVQNVELTFAGVVDPYFRGDANIVLQIDQEGETVIELEEAYLTSLDLPFNLQVKAGQFFTEFGRLNPTHPHTWDFVDQPVVNSRLFGPDGLRSQGIQLSWLTPLPFFAELVLSAQNAHGETAVSFRNAPEESIAGRTLIERDVHDLGDLLYLARLRTSFDPAEDLTVVAGLSALFGPNASGTNTNTHIYGTDLYLKWRALDNEQGWPFVAWQTEALLRRYQAAQVLDDGGAALAPATTLDDAGFYSQLVWGFSRPWAAAIRYDRAWGEDTSFDTPTGPYASNADPLRDSRQRYAAAVSYYTSEFSKLRLQYNYDRAQFSSASDAHSVYAQFEILFGAHGAHKF